MTEIKNREEKSFRLVAMVAKFLDLNKPLFCKYGRTQKKKSSCMTFLCITALSNKMVARAFSSIFGTMQMAVSAKKDY